MRERERRRKERTRGAFEMSSFYAVGMELLPSFSSSLLLFLLLRSFGLLILVNPVLGALLSLSRPLFTLPPSPSLPCIAFGENEAARRGGASDPPTERGSKVGETQLQNGDTVVLLVYLVVRGIVEQAREASCLLFYTGNLTFNTIVQFNLFCTGSNLSLTNLLHSVL